MTPQQILFIKLLELPTSRIESKIKDELETNPALEEWKDNAEPDSTPIPESEPTEEKEEIDVREFLHEDEYYGYKMQGDGIIEEETEPIIASVTSLSEQLQEQLSFFNIDERKQQICYQLIGSIDQDGYIRRNLHSIIDDLSFLFYIDTNIKEIEELLTIVQALDPPGIAARNLQECLLLQLERKLKNGDSSVKIAYMILYNCFEDFVKKNYQNIIQQLELDGEEEIKKASAIITKLNPKPGFETDTNATKNQTIIPDFILTYNNEVLELSLNSKNDPQLHINKKYSDILRIYEESAKNDTSVKNMALFVKQKLESAKWFINAINQRKNTLLETVNSIIDFQKEFFKEGNIKQLKPMVLKDIAVRVNKDTSTISRIVSNKYIQTHFGTYLLKQFFSEKVTDDQGNDTSLLEVKNILKELIAQENKKEPYLDAKLAELMTQKGFNIARRTIANYREEMNIPNANMRKKEKK